ncbi:hypothetical protein [Chloroflexus sp.]|uniref:hypothetical protein n=1 Tax=Chloroflexus sp. TaxID=1904827 RepID=UPI002ACDCEFF|nr:hypothetical protein [Chloroflexus sp.]
MGRLVLRVALPKQRKVSHRLAVPMITAVCANISKGTEGITVAPHLNQLRKLRNDCDYNDYVAALDTLVQHAVQLTDKVVRELEE